ncbi:MAG: MotA/TolQ/ExbB proton channel family protein [Clostridia bacterium]|nr:MotA/TolQ/ExbB proton channel family protein [Clostridia bacterium]
MSVWESIQSWLGNGFSVFVYIAIITLFIIGFAKCIIPVMRTRDLLRRAVASIKKGDKAKRSWQDDRFLGKGALMSHWSEYLNNLFFADGEYHNPANVEDYINEETAIDGPGRVHLAEAVPGVLVSLGFLGTLLGLSVSLSGMSGVDAEAVSTSMSALLSSMKYAFLTSIFGVVASIIFTLLTRIVHGRAERALTEFYNAMARQAGVLSVDPMTQIAIYQQEQTGLLKSMLKSISTENTIAMIRDAMEQAVLPLSKAVSQSLNLTSNAQAKLMNDVAEAYIRKMDEAVHGQFDHLAMTIEDTCRYQEKSIKSMTEALGGFQEAARGVREMRINSEAMLEKYDAVLSKIAKIQARYEDSQEKTETMYAAQTEYMEQLSFINEAFSRQSQKISDTTAQYMDSVNKLNRMNTGAMNEAVKQLVQAGDTLAGRMAEAREKLSRDMDESLNYFEACMTEILKRIEWASAAVRESVEGLPEAVNAASEKYLNEIDDLTLALRSSRENINRADGAGN